jgi:hypothetical protein
MRQVSWVHRPFIFDSDYKVSRTMSLEIAHPPDVSSEWGLFESPRKILWVGSEGYANFKPVLRGFPSSMEPSKHPDHKRACWIAWNTRETHPYNKSSWEECGLGDIFEEVMDDETLQV